MNPIIYIGCACAAINLALTVWQIVNNRKPAVQPQPITYKFPAAR